MAIEGYVIRKTLDLLFFFPFIFLFSLKNKTEQTKIPRENPFRCSYKYFMGRGGDPITEEKSTLGHLSRLLSTEGDSQYTQVAVMPS